MGLVFPENRTAFEVSAMEGSWPDSSLRRWAQRHPVATIRIKRVTAAVVHTLQVLAQVVAGFVIGAAVGFLSQMLALVFFVEQVETVEDPMVRTLAWLSICGVTGAVMAVAGVVLHRLRRSQHYRENYGDPRRATGLSDTHGRACDDQVQAEYTAAVVCAAYWFGCHEVEAQLADHGLHQDLLYSAWVKNDLATEQTSSAEIGAMSRAAVRLMAMIGITAAEHAQCLDQPNVLVRNLWSRWRNETANHHSADVCSGLVTFDPGIVPVIESQTRIEAVKILALIPMTLRQSVAQHLLTYRRISLSQVVELDQQDRAQHPRTVVYPWEEGFVQPSSVSADDSMIMARVRRGKGYLVDPADSGWQPPVISARWSQSGSLS